MMAREPKVTLLPITQELLDILETLSVFDRRAVFQKAGVPYASLSAWRNGLYHPSALALHRLFNVLGCRMTVVTTHARL